jgi:hypothetical protein
VSGIADINGTTSTYTVLQFTGGSNEVYNIYYPFFTTNAAAGKTTPLGAAVPPPPTWWAPKPAPASSLAYYAPPSQMVFGASGVFADNTQQQPYMASGSSSTVLGAIENVVVTALARGYATTWQFLQGSITPNTPPTTAQVNLAAGYTTAGLVDQMDMASFQIANVPMTVSLAAGAPTSSLAVSSPLNILPTVSDLLTFSQFYPAGATWSAFAQYLHNPTVTIGGRAYALPFDDQGGFSSDLNSTTSTALPASASITLGPWAAAGHVQPSAIANTITLTWPASDDYTFIYVLSYSASGAYVCTSVEISAAHSYFNGNTYVLPTAQQTPASVPRSRQESITMYVVPLTGVYSAAVWCHIDVPGFVFEGNAFEFSNQYDGAPPLTIW